jgi:hypothetical protein
MTATPESAILLVGLSGTGKTNFLVGLDIILEELTDPNGLVHSDHAPDRAYLQPLRTQWLQGKELDHTSRQMPPSPHQLLVVHPASGTRATFHIPDLAGETFAAHFATRAFPNEFGKRIQQASGLILFLHPDHEANHTVHKHPTFIDSTSADVAEGNVAPPPNQASDWQIEDACGQVKLVDLLQFIAEIRRCESPIRVAVAISAWDLVEKAPKGLEAEMPKEPTRFLSTRWPLLAQFLHANEDAFPFHVFGVSARGGGATPEEIARLTNIVHPPNRIIVVDGSHRSNDLTRPVRWLLGLPEPTTDANA